MPELVALDLPGRARVRRGPPGGLGRRPRRACPSTPVSPARRWNSWWVPSGPRRWSTPTGTIVSRRVWPVEPGDALVVATSGSTGEPKGVVLTHEAVRASALATSARLEVDPATDRWLACLPLAHIGGSGGSHPVPGDRHGVHGAREVRPRRGGGAGSPGSHPGLPGGHGSGPDRRLGLPPRGAGWRRAPRAPARQRGHHLRDDRDGLGRRLRRPAHRRGRDPHRRRGHRAGGRGAGPGPDVAALVPRRIRSQAAGRMAAHR